MSDFVKPVRGSGDLPDHIMLSIRGDAATRAVVPDMAESTTMLPFSAVMIRQTSFILAGEPTEVPPNF